VARRKEGKKKGEVCTCGPSPPFGARGRGGSPGRHSASTFSSLITSCGSEKRGRKGRAGGLLPATLLVAIVQKRKKGGGKRQTRPLRPSYLFFCLARRRGGEREGGKKKDKNICIARIRPPLPSHSVTTIQGGKGDGRLLLIAHFLVLSLVADLRRRGEGKKGRRPSTPYAATPASSFGRRFGGEKRGEGRNKNDSAEFASLRG